MNVGTIVGTEMLAVRLKGRVGAPLGEVEEDFAASLTPGDTFLIGGETVRYEGLREMVVEVTPPAVARAEDRRLHGHQARHLHPALAPGGRRCSPTPPPGRALPDYMQAWLATQARVSRLPRPDRLLVETFPRGDRAHLALYGFAGRNAHQTLGLLVTRRMEARRPAARSASSPTTTRC